MEQALTGRPEDSQPTQAPKLRPEEFARLFTQSFHTLWLVAVGMTRDAALAEDVVQDAAIVALGKLDQFERGSNFIAWMSQLVRYVALNTKRKERLRRVASIDAVDMDREAPPDSGQPIPLSREMALSADQPHFDDRLSAALAALSDVARSCLLLRTLGNLAYSEIAEILQIPEGTAMSHVFRTRQQLRDAVADQPLSDRAAAQRADAGGAQ